MSLQAHHAAVYQPEAKQSYAGALQGILRQSRIRLREHLGSLSVTAVPMSVTRCSQAVGCPANLSRRQIRRPPE